MGDVLQGDAVEAYAIGETRPALHGSLTCGLALPLTTAQTGSRQALRALSQALAPFPALPPASFPALLASAARVSGARAWFRFPR